MFYSFYCKYTKLIFNFQINYIKFRAKLTKSVTKNLNYSVNNTCEDAYKDNKPNNRTILHKPIGELSHNLDDNKPTNNHQQIYDNSSKHDFNK